MASCLRFVLIVLAGPWIAFGGVARAEAPDIKGTPPASPGQPQPKGRPVNFARDVSTVLSDNCFACHGPDDKARKAGLRLDTKDGVLAKLEIGQRRGRARQARRERAGLPDRDRRSRSQDAPEEVRQAVDGPADRDAPPLGRAGGDVDDALGLRAAAQGRLARRQGRGLGAEPDRPLHPGPARGRGAAARARGRPGDADPARHPRPDRPAADARGGGRLPGRSLGRGLREGRRPAAATRRATASTWPGTGSTPPATATRTACTWTTTARSGPTATG